MAGPINWLSQVASVTKFGLMSVPQRRGSVLAAVFGIAGVVAVLVGVLSISEGFRKTLASSGSPDSAIVLRSGADTEMVSGLSREQTRIIADAPGLARNAEGSLASAELFVIVNVPKRSTGTDANVPMRGVEKMAFAVREGFQVVEGRTIERGKNEIMIGDAAAKQFAGLDVGKTIRLGRIDWPVVGRFRAKSGTAESEVWADATVLQAAYNRGDSFQSVYARLASPGAFEQFKQALTADPRLNVKVLKQDVYYSEQSTAITTLIDTLGKWIAGLMAVGAVFGALNTMYSSVAARNREIATLRALGFGAGAVVLSVMLEALVLALFGGAIGAGVAYVLFNGFETATMNWQSFSQVAFAFDVTPELLQKGVSWATVIGLIGGLFPAIRAARQPIAKALREL